MRAVGAAHLQAEPGTGEGPSAVENILQVRYALVLQQLAYREKVRGDDTIVYMLHRSFSHLDKGSRAMRTTSLAPLTPSSLHLLRDKLTEMRLGSHLVVWITDYLTGSWWINQTGLPTGMLCVGEDGATFLINLSR